MNSGSYCHIQNLLEAIQENQKYALFLDPVATDSGLPITRCDEKISFWCSKLESFLNCGNSATIKSSNDVGPRMERFKWTVRKGHCESIIDSTEQTEIIDTVVSCKNDQIKQSFIDLIQSVKCEYLECCDNLRYLQPLEKVWQPLYQGDIGKCKGSFRRIIDSISWMSTVSKYYGKPESLASVFEKISNQLVQFTISSRPKVVLQCAHTPSKQNVINYRPLFKEENMTSYIEYFNKCIEMKEAFIYEFRNIRDRLKENPALPQFNFNENETFRGCIYFIIE